MNNYRFANFAICKYTVSRKYKD